MIERWRTWTDNALADYIRDELGFPGARQWAMVEKEAVDIATGEVGRERWHLLTSLGSFRCSPPQLLKPFRQHWSAPNSLHHVKDRSWDEGVHTLRHPGLGEVYATLVNTGRMPCAWKDGFLPQCPCHCGPGLAPSAQHRPSTDSIAMHEFSDFAIVLIPPRP